MPHRKLSKTADIEQRLLIDAIYLRYHYDFRSYAQASLRRRLNTALTQFQCKTLSQLQDRVLHEPEVFAGMLEYLTVQVSDMFRWPYCCRKPDCWNAPSSTLPTSTPKPCRPQVPACSTSSAFRLSRRTTPPRAL